MDNYSEINFRLLSLHDFTFHPHIYTEYESGRVISSGNTELSIDIKNIGDLHNPDLAKYKVTLNNNNLGNRILSSFEFDSCIALNDRLLFFIFPSTTNADVLVLTALESVGIPFSRFIKHFSRNEPVVGSLFTEKQKIVRLSFTFHPERLIEFE